MAFSEKRVFSSQVPRRVRWHLLPGWKVCPISLDAPHRQPPSPIGAIVDNADAVTAEVDRRAPVPAANGRERRIKKEVANAFWLQDRKVGPSRGEHSASIIGIIESSKDR